MANHRTKLTKELIKQFCKLVKKGVPADTVCDKFGIENSTYWMWLKKGAVYLHDGGEKPGKEIRSLKIYGMFTQAFKEAVADYKIRMVHRLHNSKGHNWARDLAILERRDPNSFGRAAQGTDTESYAADDRFL